MTPTQVAAVVQWYGKKFADEAARVKSYGLLETIVTATPTNAGAPNTETGLKLLEADFATLSDQDFAFLIAHTGFIPDHYGDDSCEETLYSKLVEAVVFWWGQRLGFTMKLPTAKSSTEDVTFILNNEVVVSDAKSFRLGRSQGAPNTKDAVKPEDYYKWLARHTSQKAIGGLIAFPSKFDWQRGSDVYLYASNATAGKQIMLLFYEHIAYMLLKKGSSVQGGFFDILRNYATHFKVASKDREAYWLAMDQAIQGVVQSKDLKDFLAATSFIVEECAIKAAERIETRIKTVEAEQRKRVDEMDEALLREALIASEVARKTTSDRKRLGNIKKFRL